MKMMFRVFLVGVFCLLSSAGFTGETEKIIQFNITGSQTTHPPRTYDVQISSPTNGTIGTPDKVTLTINSGSGSPASLTIRLLDPIVDRNGLTGTTQRFAIDRAGDLSGTASVTWRVAGEGSNPAVATDFTGGVLPEGAVGFAASETSKTVSLGIAGKTAPSATVAYTITLSVPTGANLGTPSSVTAQVQNAGGGSAVIWSISSPTPSVDRAEAGTTQSIEISRTNGTGAATISLQTAAGGSSPASEEDFIPSGFPSSSVSFANLETVKRITWNIAGKAGVGPTLTYDASISSPSVGSIGTGATRLSILDTGPATNISIPARINSGAILAAVDSAGQQWAADNFFSGGTTLSTGSSIAGTTDDPLYAVQRMGGPVRYTFSGLPAGEVYDMTLLFAEIDSSQTMSCTLGIAGNRRMDVYVNSALKKSDVDPCKKVGFLSATSEEVRGLTADVNGGMILEIRANSSATLLPALAGIYIRVQQEPALAERFLFFGRSDAPPYIGPSGRTWVNGDRFIPACEAKAEEEHPVFGTDNPYIYQSRCEARTLKVALPIDTTAGADRTVHLGFSEHVATATGQRLMDVTVEGSSAAVGLDVISAAGGADRAYRIRRDVTLGDGILDVTLTGTGNLPAMLNNLSVVNPDAPPPVVDFVASTNWKSEFLLPKNLIVRAFAPPRGIASSGNPLVVRGVDDTNSTMFVNHSPCPPSPVHGIKPDTPETSANFYLCVTTKNPANPTQSLFVAPSPKALSPNSSVIDTFKVQVCEVDRTTGSLVNCQEFSVGVRVSRVL